MVKYLIIGITAVAAGLLFYRLSELMSLNGEQAWYYLSARDMILTGDIPWVGVPSSHPWLHQGAFWTYILGVIFAVTQFNPLAPGYFTAGLGLLMVVLVYIVGKNIFSRNVGIIAALLYATSPLVIVQARLAYHTSFIPITSLLFMLSLYKWLKGNPLFFVATIFCLAMLYNLQISTVPFTFAVIGCLIFGFWKKKCFFKNIVNKKILSLSFLAWLIPMLPMLIYDIHHGFPQTLKFIVWIGYRVALLFGYPSIHGDRVFEPLGPFLPFTVTKIQQLIFLPNSLLAVAILIVAIGIILFKAYSAYKHKEENTSIIVLLLSFTIPFGFYLGMKTPSEAYWPMLLVPSIFMLAVALSFILNIKRLRIIGLSLIILIAILNSHALLMSNYLANDGGYGPTYAERLNAAKQIITQANGKKYTIIGDGPGDQFPAFTMNYEYLTWWLGTPPTKNGAEVHIKVIEDMKVKEVKKAKLYE